MRLSLLLVLLLPLAAAAQAFKPDALKALDRVIETAVSKRNPPGVVLRLEHAGEPHEIVRGTRAMVPGREEMTADTVFDAASLTKVVSTAPAVMLLVEQGKVELEAFVSQYLPEF
ncbi:MAG TPA: serine hydrolase domain-containing protein, partial [Prosthecobacter sp.]